MRASQTLSRRFVPGLHMVTVSPSSGGSEGLSAQVRAVAKIEVLEPADKRTAIPAEFFLEPCVSHRLPWMIVRIAQGMRTTENRVSYSGLQ